MKEQSYSKLEALRIMSVKGEMVEVIDPSLRKINVSSYKSGAYFLELVDAVMRLIKK